MHVLLYGIFIILICAVSGMADILPISPELLHQNNYKVTLSPPCHWNQDTGGVTATGYYKSTDMEPVAASLTDISVNREGTHLEVIFSPTVDNLDGVPLHHIDVDVVTTGQPCASDFGFNSLTKPR